MEWKEKILYAFCDFYGKCANMKKKGSDDPEPPSLNVSIISGFEVVASVAGLVWMKHSNKRQKGDVISILSVCPWIPHSYDLHIDGLGNCVLGEIQERLQQKSIRKWAHFKHNIKIL